MLSSIDALGKHIGIIARATTRTADAKSWPRESAHPLAFAAMDNGFALTFAEEWVAAWNSHDLDRILAHYADDVVFASPHITERYGKPSGVVQGKGELRGYFGAGLARETELHFTVESVLTSVDTIVINYRTHWGGPVAEVLRFRDGLVVWGCGAYPPEDER
jgi:ketosteroid isomerase-like protein